MQSQSCEELTDKTTKFLESGKYEEALNTAVLNVDVCKASFGLESSEYAFSLINLSYVYLLTKKHFEAEKFFLEALSLLKRNRGDLHLDYLTALEDFAEMYIKMGNFGKADSIFIEAIDNNKKKYGEMSTEYATSIGDIAIKYAEIKDYKKAEILFLESIAIHRENHGEHHKNFILTIQNLAYLYSSLKKYDKADSIYTCLIRIQEYTLGKKTTLFAKYLASLADRYKSMGYTKKAESLLIKAARIQITKARVTNDYIITLNSLADVYFKMHEYSKAEYYYEQVLKFARKNRSYSPSDYVTLLTGQADEHVLMGNFAKAERLYKSAISTSQKNNSEDNLDYAITISHLANLYFLYIRNNFELADSLYTQAIEIKKRLLGYNTPEFASSLYTIAMVYKKVHFLEKAEYCLLQCKNIQKNSLGENSIEYATTLLALGELYTSLSDYNRAEALILQAKSIQRVILGEDNSSYAETLVILSNLYSYVGKDRQAGQLVEQSMRILEKSKMEEDVLYIETLFRLGSIFTSYAIYRTADSLYTKALILYEKENINGGVTHANYLNAIAILNFRMGNYQKADSLYKRALAISKNENWDTKHVEAVYLNNLAILNESSDNDVLADSLLLRSLILQKELWLNDLLFLSNFQAERYIMNCYVIYDWALSFLKKRSSSSSIEFLSNLNMFFKGTLLFNANILEDAASKSKDSIIRMKWEQYKSAMLGISKSRQLTTISENKLKKEEEKVQEYEKNLMRSLPAFREAISNNNITWLEIKNKLNPNEAIIDFVSFRYYNRNWTDSIMYAAFVIRRDWGKPKFISLFNEDQIKNFSDSNYISSKINEIYRGSSDEVLVDTLGSKLYKLIWQPLDSLLTGVDRVYVSPSGLLHRVSFSAIPTPHGKRLIERYDLQTVINIRKLADQPDNDINIKSFTLFGGIDYDSEPFVNSEGQNVNILTDTTFEEIRKLRGDKWTYLPGTNNEILNVQKILSFNGLTTEIYTKANASEEAFKLLGQGQSTGTSVIHIATHGFTFKSLETKPNYNILSIQNNKRQVFLESQDPLTRTGLIMSGGNKIWSTGIPYPKREDGILTAREISNLDLKGCVLVTLSACETGLGEIKGSEGVFGLQRAFNMAGVKNIIFSLWQVPDKETAEFMELFYTNWLTNKQTIREAFRNTQLSMSRKYKPYQWAAFVLVE